jgi:iron(III) transport system permease protein
MPWRLVAAATGAAAAGLLVHGFAGGGEAFGAARYAALFVLTVMFARALARCGFFVSDPTVSTIVVTIAAMLGLFIFFPVGKSVVALLPIITPPFVVGLGLILLFGRAGVVNQFLEYAFGIPPTRWFYGVLGIWIAQMFAFTPIAFMIMRGVVQGVAPSLEEAAQTLRADRRRTFFTITLPLLKPGLANAFLVGFIESMADFGNPIVVGGQYSVLSTDIFFAIVGAQYDQGRAASLAWILTLFALGVLPCSAAARQAELHHRQRQGRRRHPHGAARQCAPRAERRGLPVAGLHRGGLPVRVCRWLRADLGARLHAHAEPLQDRLRAGVGRVRPRLGRHGLELALHHRQAGRAAAPVTAATGLLIAWLLARTEFHGRGLFEFVALLAFAIPGTVLGVSYILAFNVPPVELTGTG